MRPQPSRIERKGTGFGAFRPRRLGLGVGRITVLLALVAALSGAFYGLANGHWLLLSVLAAGAVLAAAALGASALPRREPERLVSFGQYTLVREIGAGGMGVVYEARHALLRRPTAVKLLRPFEADDATRAEALLRFEREVQLTSELNHPNTIVIYDYGCTEDGTFYYAMEYVDGVDLDRLVRVGGPLMPARVIHLALQICASLSEAHRRALIHRDIKPANLLVCERGGVPDTIKVLDFGLVKRLDGPIVSGANVLVGTPLFTAPEVMRDPTRASVRSDIFSLGAVMYWLTTGTTLQETAFLRRSSVPPPPGPELPIDLERVIARCTEPDPHERPESMEQLAEELRQCSDCGRWSMHDAREYWEEHGKRLSRVLSQPAPAGAKTVAAS
jgi:serine/threonine protein kinase